MKRFLATVLFGVAVLIVPHRVTADAAPQFNYDQLVNIINTNKVKSIDELLPLIPASFRSGYTLVYDSKSQQGASTTNPRAIVFGKDAKFMITFNGDPKQKGNDFLETSQFQESTNTFEFRRITFPTPGNKLKDIDFSPPNPPLCLGCHKNPPRPNWEDYSTWGGVYGSDDDKLEGDEAKNYKTFEARQKSDPPTRYKYLLPPEGDPDLQFHNVMPEQYKNGPIKYRPNSILTILLNELNAKRFAQLFKGTPNYDWMKYIVAMDLCSDGVKAEQLKALNAELVKRGMTPFKTEAQNGSLDVGFYTIRKALFESSGLKLKDVDMKYRDPNTGDSEFTFQDERMPTFAYYESEIMNDIIQNSDPSLKQYVGDGFAGSLANPNDPDLAYNKIFASVGRLTEIDGEKPRAEACAKLFADFQKATARGSAPVSADCVPGTTAAPISKQVGATVASGQTASRLVLAQKLIGQCIQCHQPGNTSGLVLKTPDDLRKQLDNAGYPRGKLIDEIQYRLKASNGDRMPPDAKASGPDARLEERSALSDLLTSPELYQ
jgi:hypothetical protein